MIMCLRSCDPVEIKIIIIIKYERPVPTSKVSVSLFMNVLLFIEH